MLRAAAVAGGHLSSHASRVLAVSVPGYAILGAKIVTVHGATIDQGTVVIRNGVVESVTDGVKSPGGLEEIDGKGLVVYPGLVDLNSTVGLDQPQPEAPKDPETREVSERWRRQQLVHADLSAADFLRPESPDLGKLAGIGVTNALVVPKGDGISGESAFIDVAGPEIDPQVRARCARSARPDDSQDAGGAARVVPGPRSLRRVSRIADGWHRVYATGVSRRPALQARGVEG